MKIRVQGVGTDNNEARELGQIQKAYQFALDRFVHSIRDVEVWCGDVNGPKGGIDKTCRVQLRLYPRGLLTAKSSGSSFAQAAKDACEKVRTLLSKKLSKRKTYNRPQLEG
jgi:putative sigma-54 modulation protein